MIITDDILLRYFNMYLFSFVQMKLDTNVKMFFLMSLKLRSSDTKGGGEFRLRMFCKQVYRCVFPFKQETRTSVLSILVYFLWEYPKGVSRASPLICWSFKKCVWVVPILLHEQCARIRAESRLQLSLLFDYAASYVKTRAVTSWADRLIVCEKSRAVSCLWCERSFKILIILW